MNNLELDKFVQHLSTERNNNHLKDMFMTSISLDNENCVLLLWRDDMKNMQDLYQSFVKFKIFDQSDMKQKLYSEDFLSLDYWQSSTDVQLDETYKPQNTSLFGDHIKQFKEYISSTPIISTKMAASLTRCDFIGFEALRDPKMKIKIFYAGVKTFDRKWIGEEIFNCSSFSSSFAEEWPVLEVYRNIERYLTCHLYCIIRSPDYQLVTLIKDFLGTMTYKEAHSCSKCGKFPISNLLAPQMKQRGYLEASERLQSK